MSETSFNSYEDISADFTGIAVLKNVRKNYEGVSIFLKYEHVRNWYKEGKLHREDGPAIEYSNGENTWILDGIRYKTECPISPRMEPYPLWFIPIEEEVWFKINNLICISSYIGKYGLTWLKIMDESGNTGDVPDIPGMGLKAALEK